MYAVFNSPNTKSNVVPSVYHLMEYAEPVQDIETVDTSKDYDPPHYKTHGLPKSKRHKSKFNKRKGKK